MPARRSRLLAPLVALIALLVAPGPASATEPTVCSFGDELTARRAYGDYATTVLDTRLRLPSGYVPRDLVPVRRAGIAGTGLVRRVMIADLRALAQAARANGSPLVVESAHRSYQRQVAVFARWVRRDGRAAALRSSARPGHSEHQLGTTIDFSSPGYGHPWRGDWARTRAGRFMVAHAAEYGFVMSYPRGATATSCYRYEPWHWRYVGREMAATIAASGLTPRVYLLSLVAAASPSPTPSPTPALEAP